MTVAYCSGAAPAPPSAAAGTSPAVEPSVGGSGSLLLQASLTLASKSRKLRLALGPTPGPPDPDWERFGRPGRAEIELFFQKVDPAP